MMKYCFSAHLKAFYLLQDKEAYEQGGTWSEDTISVSDATWAEFSSQPPAGKILGADQHRQPCWLDAPVASLSEKQTLAKEQKNSCMALAEAEISKFNIISGVYKLTSDEEQRLAIWKKYYADVYRLNIDEPDSICWPVPPEV